ncbi:MAG: hypothetical protein JWN01_1015 [Patescibacteria group bacterium]|nr:hypothetical protein [Patescibacteria group bacterium]
MPQVVQPAKSHKFLIVIVGVVLVSFLIGGAGYAAWQYYVAHFPNPTVGKDPF